MTSRPPLHVSKLKLTSSNGAGSRTVSNDGGSAKTQLSHSNEYHWLKILTIAASGALFGYAAKITNVYLPQMIRSQMVFQDFTMLQVFLAATVGGLLCFLLLDQFSFTRDLFTSIRDSFGACVESKRMRAFIGGGAILGMGMTICGGCPGMVFVQVGSGNSGSLYTLLGCFSGALVYGILEPKLTNWFTKLPSEYHYPVWVDKMYGLSYVALALPFTLALIAALVVVEMFVPPNEHVLPIMQPRSHPVIGGLIIGALQLLVGFAVRDSLGGSSSYCTLLSGLGLSSFIPYFENYRSGIGNWWQVIYWLGAVGGTTVTTYVTGTWARGDSITPGMGLLGGFMMVFGARLASGCTSGHGLSGMALLSFSSFIAVVAMFAGGIGLENIVRLMHHTY